MKYARKARLQIALLATVGLSLAACGGGQGASGQAAGATSSCKPLTEEKTLNLGIIPGSQDLVTFVMQSQGFAEKHNIKLNIREFQNPSALHAAIGQKAVDVGFAGLTGAAVLRSQGRGTMVFDILTSPSNLIFAPQDSELEDLGDLKGQKLGSFSSRSSTSYSITAVVAEQKYGLNLANVDLIEAPDAAILGLLDQGNIDAALTGTTATVRALLSDKYKVIGDVAGEYKSLFGKLPGHVVVASHDAYAQQNCGVLTSFSAALDDSIKYIQSSDEVWAKYAKDIKLTDPKAPKLLKERVAPRYILEWDQEQAKAEAKLIERLIPILGAENFVSKVPEGLFRIDIQAAS